MLVADAGRAGLGVPATMGFVGGTADFVAFAKNKQIIRQ